MQTMLTAPLEVHSSESVNSADHAQSAPLVVCKQCRPLVVVVVHSLESAPLVVHSSESVNSADHAQSAPLVADSSESVNSADHAQSAPLVARLSRVCTVQTMLSLLL